MFRYRTLKKFYAPYLNRFYNNRIIRKRILSYNQLANPVYQKINEKKRFAEIFDHYLEEAQNTLALIADDPRVKKTDPILEIGAGIGLTYGYLEKNGYRVFALEPSTAGYENYYQTGLEIFKIIGADSSGWYPYTAESCQKIKQKFKVIFSHNTLEHIPGLASNIAALAKSLTKDGYMIHSTINYLIPYEPHFNIWLIPFFPRLIARFRPWLKQKPLWQDLNFITPGELKRVAGLAGLILKYRPGIMLETLNRLDRHKKFAVKYKTFVPFYRFLKKNHLLNLLKVIPPTWQTPISFYLSPAKQ